VSISLALKRIERIRDGNEVRGGSAHFGIVAIAMISVLEGEF